MDPSVTLSIATLPKISRSRVLPSIHSHRWRPLCS